MVRPQSGWLRMRCWCILVVVLSTTGCELIAPQSPPMENMIATPVVDGRCRVPRELKKRVLPIYVIEPPDLLLIDAIHVVPKQPYHLQPYDTVAIQAGGTPAEAPLSSTFFIGPDGTVTLGPHYGTVNLMDQTVTEAKETLVKQLSAALVHPEVTIALVDTRRPAKDLRAAPRGHGRHGHSGILRQRFGRRTDGRRGKKGGQGPSLEVLRQA